MAFGIVGFQTEPNGDLLFELAAESLDLRQIPVELLFSHGQPRVALGLRQKVERDVIRKGDLAQPALDRLSDKSPRFSARVAAARGVDVIVGKTPQAD